MHLESLNHKLQEKQLVILNLKDEDENMNM